ncbi:hypothetical protein BM1_05100 [Bipolaris maydis]|nr:hypothetical protein BM1_05100 [Bipolaris maydis]
MAGEAANCEPKAVPAPGANTDLGSEAIAVELACVEADKAQPRCSATRPTTVLCTHTTRTAVDSRPRPFHPPLAPLLACKLTLAATTTSASTSTGTGTGTSTTNTYGDCLPLLTDRLAGLTDGLIDCLTTLPNPSINGCLFD